MERNQNTMPFFILYREMIMLSKFTKVAKSFVKDGSANIILETTEPFHQQLYKGSSYIAIQFTDGRDNYNEVCRSISACLEWFRIPKAKSE